MMWDVESKTCIAKLLLHSDVVSCKAELKTGDFASEGYDQKLNVWDVQSKSCKSIF
jgi:hypothetical protein